VNREHGDVREREPEIASLVQRVETTYDHQDGKRHLPHGVSVRKEQKFRDGLALPVHGPPVDGKHTAHEGRMVERNPHDRRKGEKGRDERHAHEGTSAVRDVKTVGQPRHAPGAERPEKHGDGEDGVGLRHGKRATAYDEGREEGKAVTRSSHGIDETGKAGRHRRCHGKAREVAAEQTKGEESPRKRHEGDRHERAQGDRLWVIVKDIRKEDVHARREHDRREDEVEGVEHQRHREARRLVDHRAHHVPSRRVEPARQGGAIPHAIGVVGGVEHGEGPALGVGSYARQVKDGVNLSRK